MAIPPTRFPDNMAVQYFRQIRALVEKDRRLIWRAWENEIRPRIHAYRRMVGDSAKADDPFAEIEEILQRLREIAESTFYNPVLVEKIARSFVVNTERQVKSNFKQQVQAMIGMDPTAREPWLKSFMDAAVKENVNWIKSISKEHHDKVETIVLQGVRRGKSINSMAAEIRETAAVSRRRAKFIARDQTGSIMGDLTKRRQTQVGLKHFIWRTSSDERVRDEHAKFDGKKYSWAKGAGPRGLIPGEDYNCRCVAEPVEDELFEIK